MENVLVVDGITKRFGDVLANDAVSLRVGRGEVVGLLGHNGAGKTTLVSQIVGLLRPGSGSIDVAGVDAVREPGQARRHVAVQTQSHAPMEGLSPRTAIELAARLHGSSRGQARAAAQDLAHELGIDEWLDRRALPDGRGISGGVRRLTSYAMAAVAATPLVVLDEPTNDVDPARRRRLWTSVRRLADQGAGVLVVTHNVVEAEQVVDRLVVVDRGRVVASGTPAQLRGDVDHVLRLELHLAPEASACGLTSLTLPVRLERQVQVGRRWLLTIRPEDATAAIGWAAARHSAGEIDGYALTPVTLEDTYLALTHDRVDREPVLAAAPSQRRHSARRQAPNVDPDRTAHPETGSWTPSNSTNYGSCSPAGPRSASS